MNQYKKILLLTDLTEKSLGALAYARAIAEFYNSYLGVLHVLPAAGPRTRSLGSGEEDGSKAVAVRKRLEALADALRADGISVQVRLCRGTVAARTILRNIRVMRPDLVIQGCSGIEDLRRPFVGSIAEEVLRSSDKPVLTVPAALKAPSSNFLRFKRILLATDFGNAVQTTALDALSLAQEFGARIYLCHVHVPDSKSTWTVGEISTFFDTELHRLLAPSMSDWCEAKCVVKFGKPSETILKLAQSEKCDLIVLGAHALGSLGSRGRPGIVFRVISGASCPVLTISSAKREDVDIEAEQVEVIGA